MKFEAAEITKFARDTGFPADNLERVLRLRELLAELHKHTFVQGKLVLKGGTALNLFYFGLKRLSVDIDLNYIAHIDRDATQRERPEITQAVEQIATGLQYKLQNGVDEHALREWYLNYPNHTGKPDRIQIEINFLMRACALPPEFWPLRPWPGHRPASFSFSKPKNYSAGRSKP
jgi:predicted nucleotidyltransferase component of viral defense system